MLLRDKQTDRETNGRTDRQTDRQADMQTDRQTGRQVGRQAGRHTYRQTNRVVCATINTAFGRHGGVKTDLSLSVCGFIGLNAKQMVDWAILPSCVPCCDINNSQAVT